MNIEVTTAEYADVAVMRDLYRQEANCQIIRDSMLRRGLADPYLVRVDGRVAGYAAVLNTHDKGRLSEFYVLPVLRSNVLTIFREVLAVSKATEMQAQTNIPLMLQMLLDCAGGWRVEKVLFEDATTTRLAAPDGATFRHKFDAGELIFEHTSEPVGDWVLDVGGKIVATGGFLTHYNPPYGDLYMEVEPGSRRRGLGSYLIQELKRVCYEHGRKPAARCETDNVGSRRTMENAGMLPCGHLLVGAFRR